MSEQIDLSKLTSAVSDYKQVSSKIIAKKKKGKVEGTGKRGRPKKTESSESAVKKPKVSRKEE